MVTKITEESQIQELLDLLLGGGQKRPVCIVTIPSDEKAPRFDASYIEEDTGSIAEIYSIRSGELTRQLQAGLPENCHVFGGAARCYPVDFSRGKALSVSGLFYPVPEKNLPRETQRIIGELWGMANSAGLIERPKAGATLELARVEAIFGAEVAVLVRANGDRVSLRSELAFPGVPLDKVLHKGQQVSGYYNEAERTFSLENQEFTANDAVAHFGLNTVTLGLVRATDRQSAKVAIHPNLVFEVTKAEITGNPRDVIDRYYRVGEVYSFRLYRDPQGHIRIKSNDIDDDEEVAAALSLLPGGDPWLESGRGVLGADAVQDTPLLEQVSLETVDLSAFDLETDTVTAEISIVQQPLRPVPGGIYREAAPATVPAAPAGLDAFAVSHYKGTIKQLNKEYQKLKDDYLLTVGMYNDMVRTNNLQRTQLSENRQEIADLKQKVKNVKNEKVENPWDSLERFADYSDWLSWELNKAWIETYEIADRAAYPINTGNWSYGPDFFDYFTPANLNPTQLRKVIRTVLELVSGRPADQGTERHPLTEDGTAKIRSADTAVAMRMYVEENAPGARRLHYWQLPAGKVELAQISTHDHYGIK